MNDQGPLAGPLLEGYVPEELIGQGGMGEVYRALDVRLGRPVAPKVLAVGAVEDEGSRERLLRESRLAARLDHPTAACRRNRPAPWSRPASDTGGRDD